MQAYIGKVKGSPFKLCFNLRAHFHAKASADVNVRMLKDLPGIGKLGEIVKVSAAIWMNKLLPNGYSQKLSEYQMKRCEMSTKNGIENAIQSAKVLLTEIQKLPVTRVERKTKQNGVFVNVITKEHLLQELQKILPTDIPVSVIEVWECIKDSNAELSDNPTFTNIALVEKCQICKVGLYKAILHLHFKVDNASVVFQIVEKPKVENISLSDSAIESNHNQTILQKNEI